MPRTTQPDETRTERGAESGGDDNAGEDDERDRRLPGGLAPTLGGAAAATVLVAGLAVFGTAMVRDDGGADAGGSPAGEPLPPEGPDTFADQASGRPARQAGVEEPTSTTTVPDDEDERSAEDELAVESPPERAVSAVRPTDPPSEDRQPEPAAPGGPSPSGPRPTTTTTPPTTAPPPDPDPALASWSAGWTAGSPTGGTLTVRVVSASGEGEVETAPVEVTVELSGGAHPGDGLDGRCRAAGQTVTCTIPAPAAGEGASAAIPLTVGGPGESATVSARQAGTSLGGAQAVGLDVPTTPAAEQQA